MNKKLSLRKCTGCLEMKEKHTLLRIVKIKDEYKLDLSLKMDGRGAYICKNLKCFEKALKTKGLERSFKSQIPKDIYNIIRNELILNG